MTDVHSKEVRSYNMSRIRSTDTKPEILFRKYLWNHEIRGYRKNPKMFGKPDLFFARKKLVIFIDGCFGINALNVTLNQNQISHSGLIK